MTVPSVQRSLIRAMLAFANLPMIDSDEQVEAIFRKLPFKWASHHHWLNGEEGFPRGPRDSKGRIHPTSLQSQVRRWLEGIVRGDARSLHHIAAGVSNALSRTTRLNLQIDPKSLTLTTHLQVGLGLNAEDVCTLGVAYLFDWRLLRRLRKCPYNGCGRYRVTFEGKPWNYCGLEHQREGERLKAIARAKWHRVYGLKRPPVRK